MFTLRLAFRNVTRQTGRTALSMVSIIFGVAVLILGRGFVGGLKENIIRAQIDTVSGHVLALPAGYPTIGLQHPVDELLHVDAETAAWLDGATAGWTQRTFFTARVVHGRDAMRVRVVAVDPATDTSVFPRDGWRTQGAIAEGPEQGVTLSVGVARIFGSSPGDRLIFEARTTDGAINALEVPVAGVLRTGSPTFDGSGVLMSRALAQELVQIGDGFTHLAVRLPSRDDAAEFAAALAPRLGAQAQITTWREESEGLVAAQDLRQTMLDILAFAMMAIAATGIANTVLMAAYERVREIGTLRAMGLGRGGVIRLFVTEGAIMGVAGSLLGAALGGGIVWRFATKGLDLSALVETGAESGAWQEIPMSVVLYTELSATSIAGGAAFGLLVAVLASIYPAFIASRMAPAEAVRAE